MIIKKLKINSVNLDDYCADIVKISTNQSKNELQAYLKKYLN